MADSTVTYEAIVLYDNWPGTAVSPPFPVTDMTSAAVGHNAVHPRWPVGTKWEMYCYGDQASVGVSYRQGFSTFIYLQAGPDASAAIASVLGIVCVPDATIVAASVDDLLYVMASDTDVTTHENTGLVAVCLSTVTNDYFAWYWCGGVYPIEYVASALVTDTIATNNTVAAGGEISAVTLADQSGVGPRVNPTNSQAPGIGVSLIIDA